MTRGQLFSQILTELGLQTDDRKIDPRTVFMACDRVRGVLIPVYVATHGEETLDLFCVERVIQKEFDIERDRWFIPLPFQVLGMNNLQGIRQVSLPQEDEGSFVMVNNGMLSVYSGLEAGGATGRTQYWVSGSKIYFNNLSPIAEGVLVKAVPSIFNLVSDEDEVPMPYEFADIVIEGVKQRLTGQMATPEDRTGDTRQGA